MVIKTIMLFCYDFPHKKTQDFLLRLAIEGYNVRYCIAAPKRKLPFAPPVVHVSPTNAGLIHPKDLCKILKIDYVVAEHNSSATVDYVSKHPVDLCIISGARILSKDVIEAASNRILNIHPALLPEVRGMDTLLWSIYENVPIGISAHLITPKIDSGLFILKKKLHLYKDDTIVDVSLRLLEEQSDVLVSALQFLKNNGIRELKNQDILKSTYHPKMSPELERKAYAKFAGWRDSIVFENPVLSHGKVDK